MFTASAMIIIKLTMMFAISALSVMSMTWYASNNEAA